MCKELRITKKDIEIKNKDYNLSELVTSIMNKIENREITSSLGGCPEGIVVKVINKKN